MAAEVIERTERLCNEALAWLKDNEKSIRNDIDNKAVTLPAFITKISKIRIYTKVIDKAARMYAYEKEKELGGSFDPSQLITRTTMNTLILFYDEVFQAALNTRKPKV